MPQAVSPDLGSSSTHSDLSQSTPASLESRLDLLLLSTSFIRIASHRTRTAPHHTGAPHVSFRLYWVDDVRARCISLLPCSCYLSVTCALLPACPVAFQRAPSSAQPSQNQSASPSHQVFFVARPAFSYILST